jgi:hypothetical protein
MDITEMANVDTEETAKNASESQGLITITIWEVDYNGHKS